MITVPTFYTVIFYVTCTKVQDAGSKQALARARRLKNLIFETSHRPTSLSLDAFYLYSLVLLSMHQNRSFLRLGQSEVRLYLATLAIVSADCSIRQDSLIENSFFAPG